MPAEQRRFALPENAQIKGALPQFGIGIETKVRSSGLKAGPYTLIFADAVVPVTKRVPVMTQDEFGNRTPVLRMSERGVMEEELTMDVSHEEPVTVLLGLGHYTTIFTNGTSHDRVVSEPYLHVERTYTHTRQESTYTVDTIKGTETLIMEKDGHIVRFHTVETEHTVQINKDGSHTLIYEVGILEERRKDEKQTYLLARLMFERNGNHIEQYRIEKGTEEFV